MRTDSRKGVLGPLFNFIQIFYRVAGFEAVVSEQGATKTNVGAAGYPKRPDRTVNFVFGRSRVQISDVRSAILTEISSCFPQPLEANAGTVP
jgi:hypothetical protein